MCRCNFCVGLKYYLFLLAFRSLGGIGHKNSLTERMYVLFVTHWLELFNYKNHSTFYLNQLLNHPQSSYSNRYRCMDLV